MKSRLLVCVSYATLLLASPALAQQSAPPETEVIQREQATAVAAGIAPTDLTEDTVKIIKDKIISETALKNAQAQETAAQQSLQKAGTDVQSAKAEADKAYQALTAAGLKLVPLGDGKVTTDDQAIRQAALTAANQTLMSARTALQDAQRDAQILAKNPGAFTPQQRAQIPLTLKNATEHFEQAQFASNHAGEAASTAALSLLQAYNGAQAKVNAATAAQSQAQDAVQKAQTQVFRARESDQANQIFLANRVHTDSTARATKDAETAAAAARANQMPPISVLNGAAGAQLLNIVNVQKVVSDGYIKLSDLTPAQLSSIVAQGGGNIVAQGGGNIRIADLTPAMLQGIVAQGGGNIVAQGGGNIVAQGGGNIVAQGGGNIVAQGGGNIVAQGGGNIVAQGGGNLAQIAAVIGIVAQGGGNIVAQGAGNIVAQGGGNIVAQGGGNLVGNSGGTIVAQGGGNIVAQGGGNLGSIVSAAMSNAKATQTALLTAGLQASIISNDGASMIGRAASQGLISNDGGSLIGRAGTQSLISNDGASARAASIAAMATSNMSGDLSSLIAKNNAAGIVAQGGGNIVAQGGGNIVAQGAGNLLGSGGAPIVAQGGGNIVAQGGGNLLGSGGAPIVAQGGGNIVAQGGGNIVAQGGGNLQLRGPSFYKDSSPANDPSSVAVSTPPAPVAPVPPPATPPRGVAGGGFKQETTITLSGAYGDLNGGTTHTPSSGPVVAALPDTKTAPTSTVPPAAVVSAPAPARPYDPNDWTTWPKQDVSSFLPPGKTVQQFKVGAEKDLDTYRKNLAALPASGLTPAQQSQKAGMEAQIRSLEFQIDTANRSLGLPSLATQSAAPTPVALAPAAPQPVILAAEIVKSVPLQNDLAGAQTAVNNRAQQIASANQDLQKLQALRATTTDPAALKGIDAAISSAKFQIDVMQQALTKENQHVTDLQQSGAKLASAPAAAPVPVMSAAAIANSVPLQKDLAAARETVNNRAQQIASANQSLADFQAQRAKATDPAVIKGLDAAISSAKFQIDVMQQALTKENQNVTSLEQAAARSAAVPAASAPPAAPPSTGTPANAPAVAAPAAPVKITKDQQKAVHDSLRTIPGKLSAPEKKQFETLSTLVDKAATKGLTAEEANTLKNGISALATRHPKAGQQHNLTTLANPTPAAVSQPHPAQAAIAPAPNAPTAAAVPVATVPTAAPTANPAPHAPAEAHRHGAAHPPVTQPTAPATPKPAAAVARQTPAPSAAKPNTAATIQQAKPPVPPKPVLATAPKPAAPPKPAPKPVVPTPPPAAPMVKPPGR